MKTKKGIEFKAVTNKAAITRYIKKAGSVTTITEAKQLLIGSFKSSELVGIEIKGKSGRIILSV